MNFSTHRAPLCLAAAIMLAPAASWGAHLDANFVADLTELNDSGVSGQMNFAYNADNETLNVFGTVRGLVPNQVHLQHIHGRFNDDGSARNSVLPDDSLDADGDGFVEVLEAAPAYGDILLGLVSDPASLLLSPPETLSPFVGDDGVLNYDAAFDVSNDDLFFSTVLDNDYEGEDIFPLHLREYVIHGGNVPAGVEEDLPNGGYSATLPVASAELAPAPIPLPAGGLLLIGGLSAFGALRLRKRA